MFKSFTNKPGTPIPEKLQVLQEKQQQALQGGGRERIEAQHRQGKLTARERIALLADEGSFDEFDMFKLHRCGNFGMEQHQFSGDGVVAGTARIGGRSVCVYAQDFTVHGGSLSKAHAEKICKVMDFAAAAGTPVIGLNDSGGARVQEGIDSLAGYGDIFMRNVQNSGVIPQIAAILGPCAGGAVYSPAIQDFVVMNRSSSCMFVTGPKVVRTVLHETVTAEALGGADVHAAKSGVAHFLSDTEEQAISLIRDLVSYLPSSSREQPPEVPAGDAPDRLCTALAAVVPEAASKAYDIKEVITEIVDHGTFLEVSPRYAPNIVTGFARLDGRTVGVVANQPKVLAGVLDIAASEKAARFVRFCDAFSIGLLTLEDVPGFMPGTTQEHNGIIKNGAKLLYAYAEATVPKVTVILRKAYGGAYIVMNSRHLGADAVFAWPSAEIAVMGSKGAVEVIFRKQADGQQDGDAFLQEQERQYNETFLNPYRAAEMGYIEGVIDPACTRRQVIRIFSHLKDKQVSRPRRKHGNIPL